MGGCVNVHATARCLGSCFMKYGVTGGRVYLTLLALASKRMLPYDTLQLRHGCMIVSGQFEGGRPQSVWFSVIWSSNLFSDRLWHLLQLQSSSIQH